MNTLIKITTQMVRQSGIANIAPSHHNIVTIVNPVKIAPIA